MKYLVSAVVLAGLLASAAQADNAVVNARKPVLKGVVTVEEIPTVVVEAKRWSSADEAVFQKARADAAAKTSNTLADKISRGPEYAMH
jgi:hypothetical protein